MLSRELASISEILRNNPALLRRWLMNYFYSVDKLRNLCQDLQINYYSLAGEGINKANDLAEQITREQKVDKLIQCLQMFYPDLLSTLIEVTNKSQDVNSKSSEVTETPKVPSLEKRVSTTRYEHQIALSFAGEDRNIAEKLAELLKNKGIKVFYDEYEQATLWGKNLYERLQSVYRDTAQYSVVLISKAYAEKLWTRHELEQMQARAFKENREYILPLRLDDTSIPGINDTIGYIDLRSTTLERIVELLQEKLR